MQLLNSFLFNRTLIIELLLSGYLSAISFSYSAAQVTSKTVKNDRPQFEAFITLGVPRMTGLDQAITQQLSIVTELGGSYFSSLISKDKLIKIGLSYQEYLYLVDARFTNSGQSLLEPTPSNYKQNEISLGFFKAPLLLCFYKNNTTINIGSYFSYLIKSRNKHKIDNSTFKSSSPIDRKFHVGLQGELDLILKESNKLRNGLILGTRLEYQLSRYIGDSRSFKPFSLSFKLGISFSN